MVLNKNAVETINKNIKLKIVGKKNCLFKSAKYTLQRMRNENAHWCEH